MAASSPPTVDAQAMIAFARDLVAIPTENPPAANYALCVERIRRELETLALAYEIVETGTSTVPRQRCSPSQASRRPGCTSTATTTSSLRPRPASSRLKSATDVSSGAALRT